VIAPLALLGVLCLHQDDPIALEERARLEILVADPEPYVGEVVRVHVRIDLEARFLEEHLVQSFRKKLGLPVQVRLPWWPEPIGARAFELAPPVEGESFVLNGRLSEAAEVPGVEGDGRRRFQFQLGLLVERAGPIELGAGTLSFEHAEEFTESFLDGRVPVDPRRGEVTSLPVSLRARELPRVARPGGFTGAVGSFRVRGELASGAATVGEAFTWTLHVEELGDGGSNLGLIDPPAFEELREFHVLGRVDRDRAGGRDFEYELVPLRVLETFPSVAFHYFDPEAEAYRAGRTEPLPLNVAPSPDGLESIEPVAPPVAEGGSREAAVDEEPSLPPRQDLGALMPADRPSWSVRTERLGTLPLATVLLAPWALWAGMAYLVRMRERNREDAATRRARLAVHALRGQLTDSGAAPSEALAEYLGAKLRRPAASIVDAELARRLEQAGIDAELAEETRTLLQALLDEHFGRAAVHTDVGRLLALVERLEPAFAAREVSR